MVKSLLPLQMRPVINDRGQLPVAEVTCSGTDEQRLLTAGCASITEQIPPPVRKPGKLKVWLAASLMLVGGVQALGAGAGVCGAGAGRLGRGCRRIVAEVPLPDC